MSGIPRSRLTGTEERCLDLLPCLMASGAGMEPRKPVPEALVGGVSTELRPQGHNRNACKGCVLAHTGGIDGWASV